MQDINDDKELVFAISLANPKFRGAVLPQVIQLKWSSPMAERIVEFFAQPEMDGQPFVPKALYAHMSQHHVKMEIQNVLNACMEVTQSYREDVNDIYTNQMIKTFRQFYKNRVVQELFRENNHDVDKIIEKIGNLKDLSSNVIPLWNMAELDVDKVIEEELGNSSIIPSHFPFVRRASQQKEGGYTTGQLCMVCAPPGVGKTLFLAHEVVAMMKRNAELDREIEESSDENYIEGLEKQKIKVYWLAAGDMTRLDFMNRLTAIYLNEPLSDMMQNTKTIYRDAVKNFFRYIDISVIPASYVDAYGIKHFVETQLSRQNPNVIIIDYDANIRTSKGDDMYKAGEELYNVATAIARPVGKPGRLVFVASQPKIFYWDAPLIPIEAAAESSRKQAVIDMMITIGKNPACIYDHAGIMSVQKMRRGKVGEQDFYKLVDGHLYTIDNMTYNSLKVSTGTNDNYNKKKKNKWDKFVN